jgi:hypothetical protein
MNVTSIPTLIPIRLLFWNMASKATPSLVATLAAEHDPDIIILVESAYATATTAEELFIRTGLVYDVPLSLTDRIQFLVKMPAEYVQPLYDGPGMSIKHVQPILGRTFLLAAVHLPSKSHLDTTNQATLCSRWVQYIHEAEKTVGHLRTLLVGDLNMNPFEPGIVGAEGFHAISSRAVAARETRTVLRVKRPFFYNPMWSLMGDAVGPPGTYYYASSNPISYFWNTFDQVFLRAELARHFLPGDVAVVSMVGNESLVGSGGGPRKKISDHLPLIGTIRLEV